MPESGGTVRVRGEMVWTSEGMALEIIRASGVTKQYGDTVAVRGVDLAVVQGEVFGLVGPNGAGKTTLIQLLTGLLDPTGGDASVFGFDTVRAIEAVRPRIGYVSQDFTLYGTLTVEENLDFFAELFQVSANRRTQRKEELLRWSRLGPFRSRRAAALSGGMQKKLHLCSALVHDPDVLFLDEPTTGLDPVSRQELWEILYDLVADGLTLFVTTPYMDEAERCHRVALMYEGSILSCATPQELRDSLGATVWELHAHPLHRARELLEGTALTVQAYVMGDRLHVLAPEDSELPAEVERMLSDGTIHIDSFRRVPPTMEDVLLTKLRWGQQRGENTASRLQPAPRRATGGDSTPAAIHLHSLTRTFGRFVAVDGVSLTVRHGEIFGFLGPNGSGKTTTIRMLCGVLPPTSGTGEVLGADIARESHRVKPRMGYMSQRFSLYQDLTVEENLNFFAGSYGVTGEKRSERKTWALKTAGLGKLGGKLARELSSGVKQRLALCCALLHEPEIVFLDEPTAGVDPASRRELWDMIVTLSARGTTVFVTTHYLDEAENCHRLGLMYHGRLIADGSPRELKQRMDAGDMLEMECDRPFEALRLLRSGPSSSHIGLYGNRLHILSGEGGHAKTKITGLLDRAGIVIRSIEPMPLSLEDVFAILVEREEHARTESHA